MQGLLTLIVLLGMGICIGKIAEKLGRNSLLFGFLGVIPFVQLGVLYVLAFVEPPHDS